MEFENINPEGEKGFSNAELFGRFDELRTLHAANIKLFDQAEETMAEDLGEEDISIELCEEIANYALNARRLGTSATDLAWVMSMLEMGIAEDKMLEVWNKKNDYENLA